MLLVRTAIVLVLMGLPAGAWQEASVDPALREVVERFYATQQAEDVDGYLALWSAAAQRPRPEQLRYIFDNGDDVFTDVEILRVRSRGAEARVRVSAIRERAERSRTGAALHRRSRLLSSLTFVREGAAWKLTREGPVADDLALTLLETDDAAARDQMLAADADLIDRSLVSALARRGADAAQMSRYPAARTAFERALEVARRIGDRENEGEALQNIANTYYYQRNFAAALAAYEQRLAVERERGHDAGMAAAMAGIGTIRYSLAEYGPALASYRHALAIHEVLGDPTSVATTSISTGNVLYLQGDYEGAIREYNRSRDINRAQLNTFGEARALDGLGRVLMARGDYAGALQCYAGVLEEGRARGDASVQGNAAQNIGDAHFRLGNLDTARTTLEQARTHFESAKDSASAGRVWQAIALADLAAGRFRDAEQEYGRSAATCASVSDQDCVAVATAGLGFALAAQDKFPDAIAAYTKAIAAFTGQRRTEQAARAEVGLSLALLGAGDATAAADAAVRARRSGAALDNDDVLWRALAAEGRALRQLGRYDEALQAAVDAAGAADRLREEANSRPSTVVARDTTRAFALLAVLQAERGDAAAALESVERMRVHELRVTIAPVEREIAGGMTDGEREDERAAAVEVVSLHAQISRERGLPKPDPARVERLQRALDQAVARRAAQQQRLFERLPGLRRQRGLIAPASRADIEALVPDEQTVLVEMVVDDRDLLRVAARRVDGRLEFTARVAILARQALAERVAVLTQPETLRDADAWHKASGTFLEGLIPLVGVVADTGRAIVVLHEVLWRVPFEALVLEGRYIAERTAVIYAGSASALLQPADLPSEPAPRGLVVAAAPAIALAMRDEIAQTAPGWVLRPADAAEREAKQVAGRGDERASLAIGAGATESALRARLPDAGAIHLGVPFRINAGSPMFSRLLLAGEPETERPSPAADGSLDLREVMNLALRAQLVALSDGSALAMRAAAGDAATVHWAWQSAGVRALLLPRWTTDEAAALPLLTELHQRVQAGETPEQALQPAVAALRTRSEFAAPIHWAGWMMFGR